MRFSPDTALPAHLEHHLWQAARWPATARSWRVRRAIGASIETATERLVAALRNFADFVHGQPKFEVRLAWATMPERRVNRHTHKAVVETEQPFADADIAFLADYCATIPEALDVLSPRLRAAVLARQGGHS